MCGDGGAVLWPLLMGVNRAKEYLMTGDLVPAAEADRLGLTNHVVPRERLMDEAMAMARRLPPDPQVALRFNKRLVNKELEARVVQLYDLAAALEAITFETADHHEAVASFLEKRRAVVHLGPPGRHLIRRIRAAPDSPVAPVTIIVTKPALNERAV